MFPGTRGPVAVSPDGARASRSWELSSRLPALRLPARRASRSREASSRPLAAGPRRPPSDDRSRRAVVCEDRRAHARCRARRRIDDRRSPDPAGRVPVVGDARRFRGGVARRRRAGRRRAPPRDVFHVPRGRGGAREGGREDAGGRGDPRARRRRVVAARADVGPDTVGERAVRQRAGVAAFDDRRPVADRRRRGPPSRAGPRGPEGRRDRGPDRRGDRVVPRVEVVRRRWGCVGGRRMARPCSRRWRSDLAAKSPDLFAGFAPVAARRARGGAGDGARRRDRGARADGGGARRAAAVRVGAERARAELRPRAEGRGREGGVEEAHRGLRGAVPGG